MNLNKKLWVIFINLAIVAIMIIWVIVLGIKTVSYEEPETSSIFKFPDPIELNDIYKPDEWKKKDHRLDAMVKARFRLETKNGTSDLWLNNNNAGGIKETTTTFKKYDTQEDGMVALRELKEQYVNKYGYDLKAISERWCPLSDNGCVDDYYNFVNLYEEEMEKLK